MVQLSHPYMTTGKTIVLTTWTFVGKAMSLLFSMLSRFVMAFLPRSKHVLISWMQSPSSVILEPKKIKSVSSFPPSISYEVMEPDAMILVFLMLSFKPAFHSSLSPSSRGSLYSIHNSRDFCFYLSPYSDSFHGTHASFLNLLTLLTYFPRGWIW